MSAIRRTIRQFYRLVHPDLMSGSPLEAVNCNSRSLQELNAYIDRLESSESLKAPFVARRIQFFKPLMSSSGKVLNGTLRPCNIVLLSITPSADMLEREDLSVQLIHQIELAMQGERMFSNKSPAQVEIEPIISPSSSSSSSRAELQKIWDAEALRENIKDSIFGSIDERMSQYKDYQSIRIYNKLFKKYSKIKNTERRERRMSNIDAEVEEALKEKNIGSALDALDYNEPEHDTKVRIIETGFHPDLVFFDSSLTEEQRETGIARICGVNLSEESDLWLLENIWKAVRLEHPPAVPVVLSHGFGANLEGGCLEIPFDFSLPSLVEFLEENLEPVRKARKHLLASFKAV